MVRDTHVGNANRRHSFGHFDCGWCIRDYFWRVSGRSFGVMKYDAAQSVRREIGTGKGVSDSAKDLLGDGRRDLVVCWILDVSAWTKGGRIEREMDVGCWYGERVPYSAQALPPPRLSLCERCGRVTTYRQANVMLEVLVTCGQHVRFGYEASRHDAIEMDEAERQAARRQHQQQRTSDPGAKSPCPSEGKGSPLKWLVRTRPEGRPINARVGCSCRRCWLWLTLLGRAPRRLKIESEACETFPTGLYEHRTTTCIPPLFNSGAGRRRRALIFIPHSA